MKKLRNLTAILAALFFLPSCGDNHDKLMKDQIAWMEDMTAVFNSVADGSLSSSEAAERIKELGKDGEDFMNRKAVLNKDLSPEDTQKLMDKYSSELSTALKNYMTAMQNVVKSGRMTKELSEAVENMKQP